MGRKAEISEERVFAAIRQIEEQGNVANAGALKTHFNVGCAVRYNDLLNQYLANRDIEQRKAEQLEAVPLPSNIRDLMEKSIIIQSENYRNDVVQAFNAALEIGSKRTENMRVLLEEHKTLHDGERRDFFEASGIADEDISILNEKLLILEDELERNKSQIGELQGRIVESHNSFIYLAQRDNPRSH